MGRYRGDVPVILYASNTDNLIIERIDPNGSIECRYGRKVIDVLLPSGNDQRDTRIARLWVINNRWNGAK